MYHNGHTYNTVVGSGCSTVHGKKKLSSLRALESLILPQRGLFLLRLRWAGRRGRGEDAGIDKGKRRGLLPKVATL